MLTAVDSRTIADKLLARVRAQPGCGTAAFAEAPEEITGGYDTQIFSFQLSGADAPWDVRLILRLFRPDHGDRPRIETAVQNAVADLGYPCPRALLSGGAGRIGERPFMIMERVNGKRLIDYVTKPGRATFRVTPTLAEAHTRLHALDPAALRERLRAHGLTESDFARTTFESELADLGATVAELKLEALTAAMEWVRANRRTTQHEVICHGDFHPANIMLEPDGTYHVIDWSLIRFADPEYDIARSVILWRRAPIDTTLVRGPVRVLIGAGRRLLLFRYKRLYRQRRPFDPERLRYYEAFDALRVIALTLAGRNTTLWRTRGVLDGLARHVESCTGLKLGRMPVPAPPI
jgi:aminoglycoside phosphotransferase (APT) family kinase protein